MNNLKWFTYQWWEYLFDGKKCRYNDEWFWRLRRALCRARGHAGVVWFNPNGYEPDMTCKCCGDDLG